MPTTVTVEPFSLPERPIMSLFPPSCAAKTDSSTASQVRRVLQILHAERAVLQKAQRLASEELLRHQNAGHRQRMAVFHELKIIRPRKGEVAAHGLKRAIQVLKVFSGIRRICFARFAGLCVFLHNPHELLRIAKGKRTQQNGIHNAENCHIRADSKREIKTAMTVNPRSRRIVRKVKRRSCMSTSTHGDPRDSRCSSAACSVRRIEPMPLAAPLLVSFHC